MRAVVLLLCAACLLIGQTSYTFSDPQPSRIPGLIEYRAIITNFSDTSQQVFGLSVYEAAKGAGIRYVLNVGIQKHIDEITRVNGWRILIEACKWIGLPATIAVSPGLSEIKEKIVTVGVPLATTGCVVGQTIASREYVKPAIPEDLLPPILTVPAHTRVDYAIYGQ